MDNLELRSTCEQGDMAGYGWDEYDIRNGGVQTIHDSGNAIDITTTFVKVPGGSHGGSWGLRVKGVPRDDAPIDHKTTIIFQAGLEGLGSLEIANDRDTLGYEDDVVIDGNSQGLGEYSLRITAGAGKHPARRHPESFDAKPLDRTMVYSSTAPEQVLWQCKGLLGQQINTELEGYKGRFTEETFPPPEQVFTISNDPGQGNYHLIQKVFEGQFEFDVLFSSSSAGEPLTSSKLDSIIPEHSKSFRTRFMEVFHRSNPFSDQKYDGFAKNMFSNLFGGIGYFFGEALEDRSNDDAYLEENEGFDLETQAARALQRERFAGPYELFTSVPSRPHFPRGFLWDEGFHLVPIAEWDMDVVLTVLESWYNLIDEDGWIAREQILGLEARSKVPPEFAVQYPHYANPPTLYLILEDFIDRVAAKNGTTPPAVEKLTTTTSSLQNAHLDHPEVADQYLRKIYPSLKSQYEWFRRTQAGDIKSYDREAYSSKEAYRWRGRTATHCLTSGLDDYPRPQPPHPGELHVDLLSWMALMSRSLVKISTAIGEIEDAKEYAANENAILRNLDDLHWSEKEKTFCDATIDEYEEHTLVCHKGYISIFPFLTGNLKPDSPRLKHILDLIGDKNELWSDYGIRSMSKSSPLYMSGEKYWTGPVWINMNYMILTQLYALGQTDSRHATQAADLYNRLRVNLVEVVYNNWKETGFAWEQYDPDEGVGRRTQQ